MEKQKKNTIDHWPLTQKAEIMWTRTWFAWQQKHCHDRNSYIVLELGTSRKTYRSPKMASRFGRIHKYQVISLLFRSLVSQSPNPFTQSNGMASAQQFLLRVTPLHFSQLNWNFSCKVQWQQKHIVFQQVTIIQVLINFSKSLVKEWTSIQIFGTSLKVL